MSRRHPKTEERPKSEDPAVRGSPWPVATSYEILNQIPICLHYLNMKFLFSIVGLLVVMTTTATVSAGESATLGTLCALAGFASDNEQAESACNELGFCVFTTINGTESSCDFDTSLNCEGSGVTYKESLQALVDCGPSTTECNCVDEVENYWAATFHLFGLEGFSDEEVSKWSQEMSDMDSISDNVVQYFICTEEVASSDNAESTQLLTDASMYLGTCDIDAGDIEDRLDELNSASGLQLSAATPVLVMSMIAVLF